MREGVGGKRGEMKGLITERRFRKGMEQKRDDGLFPSWLSFVISADENEDAQGIDMWAYTDVGKIPLQIKASEILKERHQHRHNRSHILCIVVPINKPFDEIFSQAISMIEIERSKLLAERTKEA